MDFEIEHFEEEVESESISSRSGPESDIDEGELGEYDDESNAPQAASGVVPEVQWRIYGGGGLGGLTPPPPWAAKKKKLMCIEKRHHNMSRPTQYVPIALCLRLSLRQ